MGRGDHGRGTGPSGSYFRCGGSVEDPARARGIGRVTEQPPIHPGELLREDMATLGLSARALADAIAVPHNRISAILRGERAITADTALRLSAYLGTEPEVWMNLQTDYELKKAELEHGPRIRAVIKRHGD